MCLGWTDSSKTTAMISMKLYNKRMLIRCRRVVQTSYATEWNLVNLDLAGVWKSINLARTVWTARDRDFVFVIEGLSNNTKVSDLDTESSHLELCCCRVYLHYPIFLTTEGISRKRRILTRYQTNPSTNMAAGRWLINLRHFLLFERLKFN